MIYFKYIVWGGILMLCVIAKIDPKSKARFLKLQGKIEKLGISVKALHGHITLVSYIGEDEAAFIASCKEILSSCKVFPVCYDKIEVLASSCIVVASPRKEGVLEAMQGRSPKMGERLARLHAGRCVVSAHNTFAGYAGRPWENRAAFGRKL